MGNQTETLTGVGEKASEFSLEDQNGNVYSLEFPQEKIVIVVIGDKDSADQIEGWLRPLYERYGKRLEIYGIADLSAVPSFGRGVARAIIRQKTSYSVMLDWNGAVSRRYGFERKKANIFVIDRDGTIVARQTGAADAEKLSAVFREIDALPE